MSDIRTLATTFLACHDAFILRQAPATAYAMKDAADALRVALAASPEPEGERAVHGICGKPTNKCDCEDPREVGYQSTPASPPSPAPEAAKTEAERDAALRERDEIHRVAASRAGRDINAEVIAKQAAESAALRSRLEECERQRDAAVKAGAAMSEARETLENVLVSKHGGEPIALLAELDEARSRLKDTQDAARWFLPAIEDTFKNLSPAHGAAEVREFGTRLAILRGALSASDPKEGAR